MFETQIARGMALLDEKVPGWDSRINVDSLEMGSCTRCVIGQLTGGFTFSFFRSLVDLDITYDNFWPTTNQHGFSIFGADSMSVDESKQAYTVLTQEWREAIKARKEMK